MRREFLIFAVVSILLVLVLALVSGKFLWLLVILLPIISLGLYDITQSKHSITRNFPLLGHSRYLAESLRAPIRQYFIESDLDGAPLNRRSRSLVYQRAKGDRDTIPFGTQSDVYQVGYEWIGHSMTATSSAPSSDEFRVKIGGSNCKNHYSASIFNVSAMSFGSLSSRAVLALNAGARIGNFAHNTGEGGVSPYHLEPGGDLIWQIGTGYFGCRGEDGKFSSEAYQKTVASPEIKMIELKISQGAKPGHGGILPAKKNTLEIAKIRGVEPYTQVDSPPTHSAFSTPIELMKFVGKLRDLADGRPVGIKLCLGRPEEFVAIFKGILAAEQGPDFISIDGGEGGTGAAPPEYSNSIGMPLRDGLAFAADCLDGFGLRDEIKLIASGKIISGFDIVRNIALGADLCYNARGMMLALGCIQALECNSNICPTGVATQDPKLVNGLIVKDKKQRVANYHSETVHAASEIVASMGFHTLSDLSREHIFRRVSPTSIMTYEDIYPSIQSGDIVDGTVPARFQKYFNKVSADSFLVNKARTHATS